MTIEIRTANLDDLDKITFIEASCFPEKEAASKESFKSRIETFQESFFVGVIDGEMVSMINGCVTNSKTIYDELFHDASLHNKDNDYQAVFGLCTLPQYQKQGLGEMMLCFLIETAQERGKKGVILTCKEKLIRFYEKIGFENLGISKSTHGGEVWYDMIKEF